MTNHTKSHSNKINQENELCLIYIAVIVVLIIAAQINSSDTQTYNYLQQQTETAQRNKIYPLNRSLCSGSSYKQNQELGVVCVAVVAMLIVAVVSVLCIPTVVLVAVGLLRKINASNALCYITQTNDKHSTYENNNNTTTVICIEYSSIIFKYTRTSTNQMYMHNKHHI